MPRFYCLSFFIALQRSKLKAKDGNLRNEGLMPLFERTDGSRHLRWNLPEIFSTRLSKNFLFTRTSLKATCQAEKICLRHPMSLYQKSTYMKRLLISRNILERKIVPIANTPVKLPIYLSVHSVSYKWYFHVCISV